MESGVDERDNAGLSLESSELAVANLTIDVRSLPGTSWREAWNCISLKTIV
jgi:hypothetical protein